MSIPIVRNATGANRADASGRLRTDRARGRLRTDRARGRSCGRTGRAHAQTNKTIAFIIRFISIHLLNNFHELTQDIQSPILTPRHLLVPFAKTFFFHGNLLLDSQSFLQFHDRATLILERILLFVGS